MKHLVWEFDASDIQRGRRARKEFISYLQSHAAEDSDFNAAEIIFGELASNAARHAFGTLRITLSWDDDTHPTLTFVDQGPGFTYTPRLPSQFEFGKRGLFIVSELSRSPNVASTPGRGTAIRAVLPISRRNGEVKK